jgi:molybdate transport system substrate-binding protein
VIAKVGYGVFARKGAIKPDVGSVEAFKRAVLNARSIAAFEPGPAGPNGPYVARLFDQLGISGDVKPKMVYSRTGPTGLFESVATGNAEIGIAQISEIMTAPGIELVAPVPSDIQSFTVFATAIPSTARQPEAAKTLIAFLTSPTARSSLSAKGLEKP